jgi:hypothetical protein
MHFEVDILNALILPLFSFIKNSSYFVIIMKSWEILNFSGNERRGFDPMSSPSIGLVETDS